MGRKWECKNGLLIKDGRGVAQIEKQNWEREKNEKREPIRFAKILKFN